MLDVYEIREFLTKARSEARVLIVDDEPSVCSALSLALEESGLTSVTCANAEDACVLLENEAFQLLVSDKNLPGMSGLSLLVHARAVAPRMPVVMITGFASIDTVRQAILDGAFDYIAKPFDDIFRVAGKLADIVHGRIHLAAYERIAAALLSEFRSDGFDSELSKHIGVRLGALKKVLAASPDVLVFDDEANSIEIASSFRDAGFYAVRATTAGEVLRLLAEYPTLSVVVLAADLRSSETLLHSLRSEQYLRIVLSSKTPILQSTLIGLSNGAVDLYARDYESPGTLAVRLRHRIKAAQREQLYTQLFSILHTHSDLVGAELVRLIQELAPKTSSERSNVPKVTRKKSDSGGDDRFEPDDRFGTDQGDTAEFLKELAHRS
jgi:DNA-binding NtrC family response regulator